MATFVLIDHSLKGMGEHHFDYAVHILRAAESAGYEIVLATNQRFQDRSSLPANWRLYPLFRYDMHSKFAFYIGNQRRRPVDPLHRRIIWTTEPSNQWTPLAAALDLLDVCRAVVHGRERRRRLNYFTAACEKLFQHVRLNRGDHVFLPSMTEFDFLGLVPYLKGAPDSQVADWHCQLHCPILEGRPPDHERQRDRVEAMRRHFREALRQVPDQRLHFYATTEQLADQCNHLRVAHFEELAYPVSKAFRQRPPSVPSSHVAFARPAHAIGAAGEAALADVAPCQNRPLRVTCAGTIRKEKGQQHLVHLLNHLWNDYFATGKLQLVVQSDKPAYRLPLPNHPATPSKETESEPCPGIEPVLYAPYPLNPFEDKYVNLIRDSDIGLFLYDSDQYYARYSAILGEMLTAGVPVIVPAGCWLSEQIAEPTYDYLERLPQTLPVLGRLRTTDVLWRNLYGTLEESSPIARNVRFGDALSAVTGELAVPNGSTDLLVTFRWARPTQPGAYIRLQSDQYDADGQRIGRSVNIVGQRRNGGDLPVLIHLQRKASRVRLTWKNAYNQELLSVEDVQIAFLSASELPSGRCPAGAVGLAAADPRHAIELLEEMEAHYAHYRATAAAFSDKWFQAHEPKRTVAHLMANGCVDPNSSREAKVHRQRILSS